MSTATLNTLHMAHLGAQLSSRVFELGPAPVELPEDVTAAVVEELTAAGLTHTSGALTELGQNLCEPLADYDRAYWGMLLLHNQRQPVKFEIDEKWLQYLEHSFIDTPRIYFLIAQRGDTVTTAVRNADRIDISQSLAPSGFPAAAAQALLRLGDPGGQWVPSTLPTVAIPYDSLDQAPMRRPNDDADQQQRLAYQRYSRSYTSSLRNRGLDDRSISAINRLLSWDNVASTQVLLSVGPTRATPQHSVTIDYFYNAGVAVSFPRLIGDGSYWKTFDPAHQGTVTAALSSLAGLPSEPRDPVQTATANNPAPDAFTSTLLDHPGQ